MTLLLARSARSSDDRRGSRRVLLVAALVSALVFAGSATANAALMDRHLCGVAQIGNAKVLVPFDVSSTGALTEHQDQVVSVPSQAGSVVVSRDARTVYVGSTMGSSSCST
jgi:hypothetical protein